MTKEEEIRERMKEKERKEKVKAKRREHVTGATNQDTSKQIADLNMATTDGIAIIIKEGQTQSNPRLDAHLLANGTALFADLLRKMEHANLERIVGTGIRENAEITIPHRDVLWEIDANSNIQRRKLHHHHQEDAVMIYLMFQLKRHHHHQGQQRRNHKH